MQPRLCPALKRGCVGWRSSGRDEALQRHGDGFSRNGRPVPSDKRLDRPDRARDFLECPPDRSERPLDRRLPKSDTLPSDLYVRVARVPRTPKTAPASNHDSARSSAILDPGPDRAGVGADSCPDVAPCVSRFSGGPTTGLAYQGFSGSRRPDSNRGPLHYEGKTSERCASTRGHARAHLSWRRGGFADLAVDAGIGMCVPRWKASRRARRPLRTASH
jgi:hypothetical protein